MRFITYFPLLFFLLIACQRTTYIDDLGDKSFVLINQDSVKVTFPDDYEGKYVVMGFIYTNCPDICPLVTKNLKEIQEQLNTPDDVHFLGVSFDPKRDTPSVLKKYQEVWGVDKNFDFITGDSIIVAEMMDSMRVRTQVSFTTTTEAGDEIYFLNHSDKMMVMDPQAKLIIEYGGSQPSVPRLIVEDLQAIR
ncbi:MAG: SCO family protein [Balneolales bacterium]|nr:SCO family protein [Balneolales bacterium]